MKRMLAAAALVSLAGLGGALAQEAWSDDCASQANAPLLEKGCAALDDVMRSFNAHDAKAWAASLHDPHMRLAGGAVLVWPTAEPRQV